MLDLLLKCGWTHKQGDRRERAGLEPIPGVPPGDKSDRLIDIAMRFQAAQRDSGLFVGRFENVGSLGPVSTIFDNLQESASRLSPPRYWDRAIYAP